MSDIIPDLSDSFANPFILCVDPSCQQRVTNVDYSGSPPISIPCMHTAGTDGVCPSWGPVDGCTCTQPHRPARRQTLHEDRGQNQ